jgi:hypothetical protein
MFRNAPVNIAEARAQWQADRAHLASLGVDVDGIVAYRPESWGSNYVGAMDALPGLGVAMDSMPASLTVTNSGIPAMLTTTIDPTVMHILFTPSQAAEIFGEQKKGTWLDDSIMFPIVEHAGEVTSYGDYATGGHAGANTNWPSRQNYIFQIVKEYGERELARAGLAKINWVNEIDQAASVVMKKFENLTYFYGVKGLQNYGLLNDPGLGAALTPAVKGHGGVQWVIGSSVVATANEVYSDIEAMYVQLVVQSKGLVSKKDKLVLALSPQSEAALTATNSFNVNVSDLLKKNFPNLEVKTAIQYGALSASNPQGNSAGEFAQMFVKSIDGQDTGFCAYSEKLRTHPVVRELSSFKQKQTGGTWGAVIKMPIAIVGMVGL